MTKKTRIDRAIEDVKLHIKNNEENIMLLQRELATRVKTLNMLEIVKEDVNLI